METADRIRLCEAMGWKRQEHDFGGPTWIPPGEGWERPEIFATDKLPDPFTDANDCEALIEWLNKRGWIVRISIGSDSADVWIETLANECHDYSGDDWKKGVCELALKVTE